MPNILEDSACTAEGTAFSVCSSGVNFRVVDAERAYRRVDAERAYRRGDWHADGKRIYCNLGVTGRTWQFEAQVLLQYILKSSIHSPTH